MYKITVSDILKLPILEDATIITGSKGLNNPVSYISVYDNYIDENDFINANTRSRNAVYLTSMYHSLQDPEYLSFAIRYFHKVHAAAVLITDEYITEFKESDCVLADSLSLPLISISKSTPYSLLISKVSERLLFYQQMKHSENILTFLTDKSLPEYKKQDLLNSLNPFLANTILCFYLSFSPTLLANEYYKETAGLKIIEKINRNTLYYGSFYRDGILIIKSFKGTSSTSLQKHISAIIEIINEYLPEYNMGVSNLTSLYKIGEAISQAYTAAAALSGSTGGILNYNELGVTTPQFRRSSGP